MTEEDKENAQNLVKLAKSAANDGNLLESMALFKKAYVLFPSEKTKEKMTRLQEFIDANEEESEEENDEMVDIGMKFSLHKSIAHKLYQYQKEGVLWFWKLFRKNSGGILGDDMGLGKTIQVIAFLSGVFDKELIKSVIIVAPLAVLVNWEKEFEKWAPGLKVRSYHGTKKKEREKNLKKVQKSRGVLLTTYGMVVSNIDALAVNDKGEEFVWDYIILDEGHKIRNPNKTSANIRKVPARFHYILTGTAIQNNLMEMWSLFDFTQEGQLLGKRKTFEIEFQKPIVRAREKDANSYCQQVGNQISERLRALIAPYFLRRTKADIFSGAKQEQEPPRSIEENNSMQSESNCGDDNSQACVPKLTAVKYDLIIWVYLNPLQLKLYQGIVQSERVKETLMTTRSPLAELNIMKKICDHPRLQSTLSKFLTSAESREARLECQLGDDDAVDENEDFQIDEAPHAPPVESLIEDSGKMVFLSCIMQKLKEEGHRTLIFSQSRKMLDIIQKVLMSLGHKLLRIDGTITNPQDREKIITKFQTDHSYDVMLMTTQIGSVGLTLTSADRLIIFDPSWNPGTDAQAVDRIYRLGQKKDVVIYRLITCGSIEEKIYRKQIFKNAIMKQTTGSSDNPYRYFTNQELRELFVLDDPRSSITQQQLHEMHPPKSNDETFLRHLEFLNSEESVFGVTHHNLLFSEEASNEDATGFEDQLVAQVQRAMQRVTEEVNDEIVCPKTKDNSNNPPNKKKSGSNGLPMNEFLLGKEDEEDEKSCDSASVMQASGDETASVHQSVMDTSSDHNNSKNEEKSSIQELYESCIDDIDAKMKMAKVSSPDVIDVNDASDVEDRKHEELINDSVIYTSHTNAREEDSSSSDLCHVDDTDLEESCKTGRSEHSFDNSGVIFESFADAPENQSFTKNPVSPNLIHDLGKSYRTPPLTPLLLQGVRGGRSFREQRKSNRDASTPLMNSTRIGDDGLAKQLHMTLDLCDNESEDEDSSVVSSHSNVSNSEDLGKICDNEKFEMKRSELSDVKTNSLSMSIKDEEQKRKCVADKEEEEGVSFERETNEEKCFDNKSFVDLYDVGCSPISILPKVDECHAEVLPKVDEDIEKVEGSSFVDLHDVGCSPIVFLPGTKEEPGKKEEMVESSNESLTDTVPILASSNLHASSGETLSDTLPVDNMRRLGKVETITKCDPPLIKSSNDLLCTEIISDESEECHFDFGRIEKLRELSLQKRKSTTDLKELNDKTEFKSPLESADSELLGESDSMSDIYGYCKQMKKPDSAIKLEKTPLKNKSITCKNVGNNSGEMKPVDGQSHLKSLISLLREHMNDGDLDDHVLINIADLVKRCNLHKS